jgi:hypothetical protein
MKRKALLLIFTAVMAFAIPARAADILLFAFTGFDYQDPNTNAGTYLDVGEGYHTIGFVTSFGPDLTPYVDESVNEYTVFTQGLTVSAHNQFGTFLVVNFANGGRGRYYQDPISGGTHGTYGTNPPNATAPSTFTDGSMRLGGAIDNGVLTYDFSLGQGNFNGDMTLDEGPDLIYIPTGRRAGWTFHGLAGAPNPTIPTGYDHQVQGECQIPDSTPTSHKTWGALKSLYR